jgi:hypothetical protein
MPPFLNENLKLIKNLHDSFHSTLCLKHSSKTILAAAWAAAFCLLSSEGFSYMDARFQQEFGNIADWIIEGIYLLGVYYIVFLN